MCNALCVKGRPARSAVQPSHPCLEARQIPWLRLIVGRTGEPVEPVHSTGSNRWFCDEKWASPVHRTGSNRWFRTSQPTKDQRTDNRLEPVRSGANRLDPVRTRAVQAPHRFEPRFEPVLFGAFGPPTGSPYMFEPVNPVPHYDTVSPYDF